MAKMKKITTIETDLVGAHVTTKYPGVMETWPLKESLSGESFGTVRAVWLGEDGPEAYVEGPTGDTFIAYLVNLNLYRRM